MNYFNSRIYSLNIPYIIYKYRSTFFIFLVRHRSNEMAKKAFLTGLQTNNVRNVDRIHKNKLFLFSNKLTSNTFDYNNYINFFYKYNSFIYYLYFKDYKFSKKHYFLSNIKKWHYNFFIFIKNKMPSFVLWKSWFSINKIQIFYISKLFVYFFIKSILYYKYYSNTNNIII